MLAVLLSPILPFRCVVSGLQALWRFKLLGILFFWWWPCIALCKCLCLTPTVTSILMLTPFSSPAAFFSAAAHIRMLFAAEDALVYWTVHSCRVHLCTSAAMTQHHNVSSCSMTLCHVPALHAVVLNRVTTFIWLSSHEA